MAELQKVTECPDTEKQLNSFQDRLKELPFSMRMFSLCMRSLYAEKAVGSDEEVAVKFRKLRDDTRKDAMVYLHNVLPVSTKVVSSIKEYFENYASLSFDQWKDDLKDIIEETEVYKNHCQVLLHMHEDILESLKKKEDQAKVILTEFKDLVIKFQEKKTELEESAQSKKSWAIGLAFVPFVSYIATPILATKAMGDMAEAVAAGAQGQTQEAAALVVSETLIPALKYIIDGLEAAAGFFSVVAEDLRSLKDRGIAGLEKPRERHYHIMRNKAGDIKTICQEFFAMLPGVRTDFAAIPTDGTDQNYVDKWLEKEMKRIKKERSSTVLQYFRKTIKAAAGAMSQKAT